MAYRTPPFRTSFPMLLASSLLLAQPLSAVANQQVQCRPSGNSWACEPLQTRGELPPRPARGEPPARSARRPGRRARLQPLRRSARPS